MLSARQIEGYVPSTFSPWMSLVLFSWPPLDLGVVFFGHTSGGQWSLKCFLLISQGWLATAWPRVRFTSFARAWPGRTAACRPGLLPSPCSRKSPPSLPHGWEFTCVLESVYTRGACVPSPWLLKFTRGSEDACLGFGLSWAFQNGCLADGMGLSCLCLSCFLSFPLAVPPSLLVKK